MTKEKPLSKQDGIVDKEVYKPLSEKVNKI